MFVRDFPTEDGKAHFVAARPVAPATTSERPFLLSPRRGKQFNSMIQDGHDSLTDADRDHLFMARADAERLGFEANTPVVVESDHGELHCRIFIDEVAPGTVQTHWPEANVLIALGPRDDQRHVTVHGSWVAVQPLETAFAFARKPA